MMTRIQVWKSIVIAIIFVGEPILFALKIPVIPIFWLKQTWSIQAVIGFCLVLLGMPKGRVWKAIVLAVIFTSETLLFTINDRAASFLIIWPVLTFPIQVFIGFYWVLLSPKIPTWSIPRRIITIGLSLIYCFWISIFIIFSPWGSEQIRNITQLGENRYYLTSRVSWSGPGCDFFCGFTVPALYKCNSIGLACELIFEDDFINVSESGLVVDKDANELQLFLSYYDGDHGGYYKEYRLFYVYGKQPRFIEGSAEFGGNIYYLARKQQEPYNAYIVFKCNQDSIDCKRLQFEYIDENNDDVVIAIDNNGKLTIDNGELIYTYDIHHSQPVCHITNCTLNDK
jgi:hypothetical protein